MKKESVIAIVLGIVLGLVVAFLLVGYIRQNQAPSSALVPNVNPVPKLTDAAGASALTISQPSDEMIVSSSSVTIKGEGSKGQLLLIQSPLSEKALELEKDTFETSFDLALGENIIHITMYSNDSTQRAVERTIRVYYLDEQ